MIGVSVYRSFNLVVFTFRKVVEVCYFQAVFSRWVVYAVDVSQHRLVAALVYIDAYCVSPAFSAIMF